MTTAEVQLPCSDLTPALDFFVGRLGFRVETIFPADDPQVASLSGHGLRLRLAPGEGDPGHIRIAVPELPAEPELVAPNGARVEYVLADPPYVLPPLVPEFVITRAADSEGAGEGRAGMLYRDLIPSRLGGRFIASHIQIPDGGPVADWVHFHKIRFQMIFCRRGWVRVAYEDQGEPFVLQPGDCVLQPPRIRHRVLEASDGLEVVEIGCPALHETLADHDMTLARATAGLADAFTLRPTSRTDRLEVAPHAGEFLFGFLLEGSAVLERRGDHALGPADAFVIPAGEAWALREASSDLQLLQVVLPAA